MLSRLLPAVPRAAAALAVATGAHDRVFQRALALGLRPAGQRDGHEAFALIRGLLFEEIDRTVHATWAAQRDGLTPRVADLYHAVDTAYRSIATSTLWTVASRPLN